MVYKEAFEFLKERIENNPIEEIKKELLGDDWESILGDNEKD